MDIIIMESKIQFKNPVTGQPTRAVEGHYNGRRIVVLVDGEEQMFRFAKDEMPFIVDEIEMVEIIKQRLEKANEE